MLLAGTGQPLRIVQVEEVVNVLPGIRHWHGASPVGKMIYGALKPTPKRNSTWLQPVTDEQYNAI